MKDFNWTRVPENTGHSGSKAEGYTRGLQSVFAKTQLDINPGMLKQYGGTYIFSTGDKIEIDFATGHLTLNFPGGQKHVFFAETETNFYSKGEFLFADFKKDENGKMTGLLLKQFSKEQYLKKLN